MSEKRNWEWVGNYDKKNVTFYIFENSIDIKEELMEYGRTPEDIWQSALTSFEFSKSDFQALRHMFARFKT